MPIARQSAQSRTTLVIFIVLLVTLLALTFRMVSTFLLPLIMGSILSILFRKLYLRLSGTKLGSKRAALFVTLGIVLILIIPVGLIFSLAVRQGISVGRTLSESGVSYQSLSEKITNWPVLKSLGIDPESASTDVQEGAKNIGKYLLAALLGIASFLPNLAFEGVLMALSCFFFLVDGRRFLDWMKNKIPLDAEVRLRLTKSVVETSGSVIWATLAASGAQAGIISVAFLSLGVPAAVLAAGATFLLAWIPMVGGSPVWALGAVYLLLQGSVTKMIALIAIGLSMGIVDNLVRASILKGRSEMHPLVSLVAIFGGIEMFGIMGVFLGPIIIALLIAVMDVWPLLGKRAGLLGQNE
ncbi:MAG: AI-2E family transporter [Cryobacterium sp.]|nr:AI-2E family transporter [Oligoflexia bacterium]